jgi:hypothetical protein
MRFKQSAAAVLLSCAVVAFPFGGTSTAPIAAPPAIAESPLSPVPATDTHLSGAFEVTVSPSPAPEHELVFVRTAFAAKFFELEVMTVREAAIHFVSPVQTSQPGEWVFVGRPGEYSLRLRAYDPERGIQSAVGNVKIVGAAPPKLPEPTPDPNPIPEPSPEPKKKVTMVTYVYEKDQTSVPRPVSLALQQLNAGGSIVATEFEEDTVDGTGDIPDQYKIALAEARQSGLPALVVQAGNSVVRVIKDPKTAESVLEASK